MDVNRPEKASQILLLESDNEVREIDFELAYLRSLTPRRRFLLMQRKSREMRALLRHHGHRTTPSITKRK